VDKITDNLWISDIVSVEAEDTTRFDAVISTCPHSAEENVECLYIQYSISDGPADTYGGTNKYETFSDAADSVYQLIMNNETVLVHCHSGVSRSVAVSAAALGRKESWRLNKCLEEINSKKTRVEPNNSLIRHAKRYIKEY
jgi:protein-tyrosine phosphatase